MVGFCIYFLVTTIFLAVLSLVLGSKYFLTKKDLAEIRYNIEHDERDEILYKAVLTECKKNIRFALSCHCDCSHGNDDETPLL